MTELYREKDLNGVDSPAGNRKGTNNMKFLQKTLLLLVGTCCALYARPTAAQGLQLITLQPGPIGSEPAPTAPAAENGSPCINGEDANGQCLYVPVEDAPTAAVPLTEPSPEKASGAEEADSFAPETLDPALSQVSYTYAKLNIENWESANIYNSAADAAAGANPIKTIPPGGIRYVSYINRADIDGRKYVLAKNGGWLRASPAAVSSVTLGRTFATPPTTNFGWVFEPTYPYLAPNYNSGMDPNVFYNREEVLQVYEIVENEASTWFRVGENKWLDRIHFRAAIINSQPPAEITADRWIEVDLAEQVVLVYENRRLIYAVMVATGMEPFFSQPGVFKIETKKEAETMTGSFEADRSDYYSLDDVPFVMYYDQARAFHGAYWRAWFGIEQSHGCINMTIGDAHWLYNWANEGDPVWVHDRTGKTPTDPSFYGAGGA